MNDPKVEKQPPVPPFVQFCCAAIPQVFDDSLSYYEAVCAMWKYLDETVKVINNNALVTEDFIAKVDELHAYVEHYFDNLDVQEEINNKLDAMVEDGTLQEIITQYIQANVAWTFNTVADMKSATNLIAGSYAQTLGFHSLNDGGGAIYYITDSGTANEMDVIAVGSLYANLQGDSSELNVKQFGCYGDNTHDDTTALNAAILYAYNHDLVTYIPKGTYCVSSAINIYGKSDTTHSSIIIKGNGRSNTYIKAIDTLTSVVEVKPFADNTTGANMFIGNFSIDGNSNASNGIELKGTNITNSRFENIYIKSCSNAGLTNETAKPNTYLSSFIKIRVASCGIGIRLKNGTNTSLRIADCYAVNCTDGYAIKGNYSTFENNCCDHATGTVFSFVSYTGTILNPGAECEDADIVFDFERTNATIVNAWTYGNLEDANAIHIYSHTASNVIFEGGKILINPSTASVDGTAEGKLFQLSQDSSVSFNKTRYSAYKTENTYNEFTCVDSDDNRYGLITKRYGGIISYIGRDTAETGGKASNESVNGNLLANAIYFGLGNQQRYSDNGTDYRWKKHTTQGDILLTRKPAEVGGIGWIQADDMTAEGASTYWTGGTYMKIPVIHSGATADRPTVGLVAGQMYFDTTLNKPIWFKSGSTWVDATGASV